MEINEFQDFLFELNKTSKKIIDQLNLKQETEWQERYVSLSTWVKHMLIEARTSLESMKKTGLTINAIESEGYLRALCDVVDYIKYLEKDN